MIIIIIMTLLDNTVTGRTSSSHCGPQLSLFQLNLSLVFDVNF